MQICQINPESARHHSKHLQIRRKPTMEVNEKDWKLFRKRLPDWQEAYMEGLVREYAALLAGPERASDKFWALEKSVSRQKRHPGVIADMRRSMMHQHLVTLLVDGVITFADLEGFSAPLLDTLHFFTGIKKEE